MSLIGETPFYNSTTRNFIIAFGNLFSKLTVCREDQESNSCQYIKVPIAYGAKNKWLSRLREDPDLQNNVNITLPRMSFEIVDYRYDGSRKIGAVGHALNGNIQGERVRLFNPIPYDVTISLSTMCKTQEDSLQLLEQIVPYFAPQMSLNIEILPEFQINKTIPVVLANIQVEDSYEGTLNDFRVVVQNFTFVAQLDFFGPILKPNGVIKQSIANLNPNNLVNPPETKFKATVDPFYAGKADPHTIVESWFGESEF